MKKAHALAAIALLILPVMFLSACRETKDTRKTIHTIGVVFTNDLNYVFDELYVYDGDVHNMGPDFINNNKREVKVGSYGVTVEEMDSYAVWLRDNHGGVYEFKEVPLQNADVAVISYTDELLLTIYHHDGGTEEVVGNYVKPGDAPDQPFNPLDEQASFKFTVTNDSSHDFTFVSMREAAAQGKGEVELYLDTLEAGKSATVSGRLNADDTKITEWVLYVDSADGYSFTSKDPFDPWSTKEIVITDADDGLSFEAVAA